MGSRRAGPILAPVVLALAVSPLPHACVAVGPSSVTRGRPTYSAVINQTEDEQILTMIVRHRYDETFGMLSVAGVTASLRAGTSVGAHVGVGPDEAFEGNLIPLSATATFETNPVITYVPLRGEDFMRRMLSPVSAEQTLLLARMSTAEVEVLRILVRRANGLVNPLYSDGDPGPTTFDRFLELFVRLRERGELDIVRTSEGEHLLLLHDLDAGSDDARELLETVGVELRPDGGQVSVPLRFFVGSRRGDGIDLETPSPLEILNAAGRGVEVPEEHASAKLARPREADGVEFLRIRSSRDHPGDAAVAVKHHGWWFFLESQDVRSKQAFLFLRTLIGLRLDEAASGAGVPTLTVPVGR